MESLVETWKRESVSCSVMSNSLQPHGLPGILQARILEWVDIPFSRSWIVKTLSCGIWDLVPPPGITPGLPALGAWSVKTLDHQRSPSFRVFYLWYSVALNCRSRFLFYCFVFIRFGVLWASWIYDLVFEINLGEILNHYFFKYFPVPFSLLLVLLCICYTSCS